MNDIEKALTVIQGLPSGDAGRATQHVDPSFIEHRPHARDGIAGMKEYVEEVAAGAAELRIIRAFQDGSYVMTQADGQLRGDGTFFDVFRLRTSSWSSIGAFRPRPAHPT